MSSGLYSKLQDSDVERGFDIQDNDAPPTYPPGPQTGGRRMNYVFTPQYPVKGKAANVVGRLYPTKEQTIDVVKDAFPTLRDYPDDRLIFSILTEAEGCRKTWSRLLDDGWVDITLNPPASMLVQVEDGPGDARKRLLITLSMIFVPFFLFIALFASLIYFSD